MNSSFAKLSFLTLPLIAFSACQDYDPLGEEGLQNLEHQKALEATINEYTKNFEARYGKIDPSHDWGFGVIKTSNIGSTRIQVANKNEWEDIYHMQVPGWPDNWFEYNPSGDPIPHQGYNGNIYHNSNNGSGNDYSSTRGNVPGGDVTDEEIAYVSWWFRTHRYPSSINVHWSDFYIQDISADNDRMPNGDVITGESAPEYERDTQDGSWKRSRTQGIDTYTLDQLKVKTMDTYSDDFESYDHIYNFNSGQSNHLSTKVNVSMAETYAYNDDISSLTQKRLMAYYKTSGTEDWAAHYSNDENWRNNYVDKSIWVMVHLHFVGESGRIYDGYYIGFDYAFQQINAGKYQIRKPDGYYSNWIVKVSPGVPLDDNNGGLTRRIMCEDLGNTWDLDFDDVVFDVTLNMSNEDYTNFTSGSVDATVTLMAAGGTMPIWVGIDPKTNAQKKETYEVHKLFNTTEDVPVNVANGYDAPIVNYHVQFTPRSKATIFDDVPIYIWNNRINEYVDLPNSVVGNHDTNHTDMNTSDKSKAPQKFAVPTSVLWLKETKQVESAYTKFDAWVQDANGTYASDGQSPWYATGVNSANLCGTAAETPVVNSPTPGQLENTGLVGTSSSCPYGLKYDVIPFVNIRNWGTLYVSSGSTTVNTDQSNNISLEFPLNAKAKLHAVAKPGATFLGWDDGTNGRGSFNADLEEDPEHPADNSYRLIPVDAMKYVMAYFRGTYTVTVATTPDAIASHARITQCQNNGGSHPENSDQYYKCNLTMECDPIDGKTFVGWFAGDEYLGGGNGTYVTAWDVKSDAVLTPMFVNGSNAKFTFTIVNPEGGEIAIEGDGVDRNGNTVTAPYNTVITYKMPSINEGYRWGSWNTGAKDQYYNQIRLVPGCLPDDVLTASLEKIYSATILCEGNGSITGADTSTPLEFTKNFPLCLTATPNAGNTFKHWTVNGEIVSTNQTETFIISGYNMQIHAVIQ